MDHDFVDVLRLGFIKAKVNTNASDEYLAFEVVTICYMRYFCKNAFSSLYVI